MNLSQFIPEIKIQPKDKIHVGASWEWQNPLNGKTNTWKIIDILNNSIYYEVFLDGVFLGEDVRQKPDFINSVKNKEYKDTKV